MVAVAAKPLLASTLYSQYASTQTEDIPINEQNDDDTNTSGFEGEFDANHREIEEVESGISPHTAGNASRRVQGQHGADAKIAKTGCKAVDEALNGGLVFSGGGTLACLCGEEQEPLWRGRSGGGTAGGGDGRGGKKGGWYSAGGVNEVSFRVHYLVLYYVVHFLLPFCLHPLCLHCLLSCPPFLVRYGNSESCNILLWNEERCVKAHVQMRKRKTAIREEACHIIWSAFHSSPLPVPFPKNTYAKKKHGQGRRPKIEPTNTGPFRSAKVS